MENQHTAIVTLISGDDATKQKEIVSINQAQVLEDPKDFIRWALDRFGSGLVMSSSFGAESALMIDIATKIAPNIPVIFIDTGYLFPETHQFAAELALQYKLNLKTYRSPMDIREMENRYGKLWETDIDKYHKIRKIEPMNRALRELGATAVLSGVRFDQTENRSLLQRIEPDESGVYKIHPLLAWPQEKVDLYLKEHNLSYHPLVAKGYESIGDIHTTVPGKGRNGRKLGKSKECGLHIYKKYN